ncbi:unnamed protein product [Owenia fusiformis]|uniref:Peroxisomal membrane protein 11B n=1 Tax=Owenia fusiformis TaxID=6347 RepID=A0A8S4PTH9_OWEFU|nr:unnamed protein product [Owenia fusiformis]
MDLLSAVVKFNNQTNGRDKLCRLFQYGTKCGWWSIEKLRDDPSLIKKLKDLEYHLGTFRKLLRFGKSLDILQGALKTLHLDDIALRATISLAKINQSLYLLLDHVIWLARVGLIDIDKKYWGKTSAKFWMTQIILNLTRNLYDICSAVSNELYKRNKSKRSRGDKNGDIEASINPAPKQTPLLLKVIGDNKPVFLDSAKNVADVWLPMSVLGHVNISPGTQGMLGVISSCIAILVTWNPTLKLVP